MDWHNLAPKLSPDKVVSAAPVEGDGGVGSIRQFNFAPGTLKRILINFYIY
jgi:hypothetical protein